MLSAASFQFRIQIVERTAREEGIPGGIKLAEPARVEVATFAAEAEDIEPPIHRLIGMMLFPELRIRRDLDEMLRVQAGAGLVVAHHALGSDEHRIERAPVAMPFADETDFGFFDAELRLPGPF